MVESSTHIPVEVYVHLNKFKPRMYQLPIFDAIENKGYRRVIAILPRRAGKDLACWNLLIRASLRKIGTYWMCYPTYSQGKKILFDAVTSDGARFLDYIPKKLIVSVNSQEMKIKLLNGSVLQVVGSDNPDALVGTNAQGIIFSEYALQDPIVYQLLRPVLSHNQGFAVFISTPRGKNSLYELYNLAQANPRDWYSYMLTVEDTQHIPLEEIERIRQSGEMSEDMIAQEFYCSFEAGVEGSYYAKYIDRMRLKGQIGIVPWEPFLKVHTAWDIGLDGTAIIFFQISQQVVRIIDYYEKSNTAFEHFIEYVVRKEYTYGRHFGPHDLEHRLFTNQGQTRKELARSLGIEFEVIPRDSIDDGIELVRATLAKVWIDEKNAAGLIKCMENYRQEYDGKRKVYKGKPLHDQFSHGCFTGDTLVLTRNGMQQIMLISENTEVLTLEGWKRCSMSLMTKKNAELVEVMFQDGTKVKCTPEHLFLTENGWKYAKDLEKNTKIQSGLMTSLNYLMEIYTDYGQMKDILVQALDLKKKDCIELFGSQLLEKYQKIVMYITKILIPLTTTFGTSNVCQKKNILAFLDLFTRDFQTLQERGLLCGTLQKQEENGIENMLSKQEDGKNVPEKSVIVPCAKKNLTPLLEKEELLKNFVTQIAGQLTIEDVKKLQENQDVYDITVPGIGHFALSNGAIVHNSDALRYMCQALPKTADGMTAQERDRIYREAYYGPSNANMPAVFRDETSYY